jgi:SAM-dependent methyltransferase
MLARLGLDVYAVTRDPLAAFKLRIDPNITPVLARPEALPFSSCHFGLVIIHQGFDALAPGLALPEIARVLHADGWVAASYFMRDDTVPWVGRLMKLLRSIDPAAMADQAQEDTLQPLLTSRYFPNPENRDFRIWVPVGRDGMMEMVASTKAVSTLTSSERAQVLTQAAAIYDGAASASQLRLPYQLRCWRAKVNQSELTTPVQLQPDGLMIGL